MYDQRMDDGNELIKETAYAGHCLGDFEERRCLFDAKDGPQEAALDPPSGGVVDLLKRMNVAHDRDAAEVHGAHDKRVQKVEVQVRCGAALRQQLRHHCLEEEEAEQHHRHHLELVAGARLQEHREHTQQRH